MIRTLQLARDQTMRLARGQIIQPVGQPDRQATAGTPHPRIEHNKNHPSREIETKNDWKLKKNFKNYLKSSVVKNPNLENDHLANLILSTSPDSWFLLSITLPSSPNSKIRNLSPSRPCGINFNTCWKKLELSSRSLLYRIKSLKVLKTKTNQLSSDRVILPYRAYSVCYWCKLFRVSGICCFVIFYIITKQCASFAVKKYSCQPSSFESNIWETAKSFLSFHFNYFWRRLYSGT